MIDDGVDNILGAYLEETGGHPNLSREKQAALFERLDAIIPDRLSLPDPYSENGNANGHIPPEAAEIIDEIAGHMLKLVIGRARKHIGKGVEFADLIQAGNIGLLRSIWRFDQSQGNRLSTYATPWIIQAITRELGNHATEIRVPIQTRDLWIKIQKYAIAFEVENGEPPTFAQVAVQVGISEPKVAKLYRTVAPTESMVSFDQLTTDDEDSDRYHFIASTSPSPEDETLGSNRGAEIQAALETLTARQAQIIRMRFGLNGYPPMTLQEVADQYKLTRERIRQIERNALRRLRHPRRARMLRELI